LLIDSERLWSLMGISLLHRQMGGWICPPSYQHQVPPVKVPNLLYTIRKTRVLAEEWRMEYSEVGSHSSLGYRPPPPEAVVPASSAAAVYLQKWYNCSRQVSLGGVGSMAAVRRGKRRFSNCVDS